MYCFIMVHTLMRFSMAGSLFHICYHNLQQCRLICFNYDKFKIFTCLKSKKTQLIRTPPPPNFDDAKTQLVFVIICPASTGKRLSQLVHPARRSRAHPSQRAPSVIAEPTPASPSSPDSQPHSHY